MTDLCTFESTASARCQADVRSVQDVRAVLRTHLVRPKNAQALYEELTIRVRGPLAAVVRQHRVTDEGVCVACGQRPGAGDAACGTIMEIVHDLGLHLSLLTPA